MQKWEYRVSIIDFDWIGGIQRIKAVDREEFRDWKRSGPSLEECYNQFGDQGWELVHAILSGFSYVVHFKRPKL